jgi:N-acetylmuramoyl-L-alanine amidase
LSLSQTVPYRVFTLDAPKRLVIDFREVDWGGLIAADILATDLVTGLRFGGFRPGWSRLVADIAAPLTLTEAGLSVDPSSGAANLKIILSPASEADFAARSGAPADAAWTPRTPTLAPPVEEGGPTVVVIDPGHGGLDPGAERGGLQEAQLMLSLAIELADRLNRAGNVRAILTRDADYFVPLAERITIARQAGADLLVSLHADALEADQARGASFYTLSKEGEDGAAQSMAERHERGDLIAGVDLSGQGDRVATVLMDLARAQTAPASDRFADFLVEAFADSGARLNSKPRRVGRLAVLTASDFASVLIEVGFLSSAQDREVLKTAQGRAPIVAGIAQAIERWAVEEAARKPLVRQ